jgi:hypothetical protein
MFPRNAVCFSVFIFTSFFYLNFSEVKISENNRIIVQVCLFFPLSYRNLSIFPDISSCNTGQTVDRGAVRYILSYIVFMLLLEGTLSASDLEILDLTAHRESAVIFNFSLFLIQHQQHHPQKQRGHHNK